MPGAREPITAEGMAASFHAWALAQIPTVPANQVASMLACDGADLAGAGLIVLRDGDDAVAPLFQLDLDTRAVGSVVAAVNRLLLAESDPWGALTWWMTENPRWGHRRPIDHADDELLVALAAADSEDGY